MSRGGEGMREWGRQAWGRKGPTQFCLCRSYCTGNATLLCYLLSYHLQSIFIIRIRMNILKCKTVSATSLLRGLHFSTCSSEKIQSTSYGLLSPIWPDLNSIPLLTLPIAHPSLLCHVINIPGLFFLWGHCVGNFLCPQSYFPIIDMIYSYFRSYRNWKCSIPVFRHFLQLWHKHMV